jgi:vancomycin permeability regulator SanA
MKPTSLTKLFSGLFLVLSFTSCTIFNEISINDADYQPYDAIIVPGFPFNDKEGKMNTFQRMRLFWALHLYETGETQYLIVSGNAVHSPYVEAEIFAIFLTELGVNPKHIIIENRAEHSTENVFYSLELAKNLDLKRVAVATDPMQTKMIAYLMRNMDVKVDYLTSDLKMIFTKYQTKFDHTIDGSPAFVSNFVPLKERESRKLRMQGTRGERYLKSLEEERTAQAYSN